MKHVLILIFYTLTAFASLSNSDFKTLQNIQELINKQEYTQAKKLLKPLLASKKKSTKVYALQTLASLHLEKLEYTKAIQAYEQILKLGTLGKKESSRIKFVLAQLYLSNEQYKKGLQYTKELLKNGVISRERLLENLTLGYYYNKEYNNSIMYAKELIEQKKKALEKYLSLNKEQQSNTSKPNIESWYKVLYASHFELKQYAQAITILKHLIEAYEPKEEYWMQLVLIYQNQDKIKSMLSTLELAYDKGFINQKNNIEYFINALLQNELYNKVAMLIQSGLDKKLLKNNSKNFKRLVTSHIQAKNTKKAIALLEQSPHAQTELFQVMLGNLYYNQSDYHKIVKNLNFDVFKKKSKYAGEKDILMALTHYELHQENLTKKYLKQALLNPHVKKRSRQIIKQLGYKL